MIHFLTSCIGSLLMLFMMRHAFKPLEPKKQLQSDVCIIVTAMVFFLVPNLLSGWEWYAARLHMLGILIAAYSYWVITGWPSRALFREAFHSKKHVDTVRVPAPRVRGPEDDPNWSKYRP